jgi:DNA-binding response OmpR family regulator
MTDRHKKPYLLIVDDEANFRESIVLVFDDIYDIEIADSLKTARSVLKRIVPDAVLLDIHLPDGNGIELIPELKYYRPQPVIVMMTAYATVENDIKVLKEGASDYVVKPFEIERLKRDLNLHLENRRLHFKISGSSE